MGANNGDMFDPEKENNHKIQDERFKFDQKENAPGRVDRMNYLRRAKLEASLPQMCVTFGKLIHLSGF